MSKLVRNGNYVDIIQPGFKVRCSVPYGCAPLEMYQTDDPAHPISVVNPIAGEGFQCVCDTGQDLTQAGANGQVANPMQPLNVPYYPGASYWGREECFCVDVDGREAVYQTSGKFPYFWASLDPEDDCIPPDPRGEHGWSTKYHDVLNFGAAAYHVMGTPIFFKYTSQVPSGIMLLGDEIASTWKPLPLWYERAAKIPGGHCAGRIRISLKHADSTAFAAVWFSIDDPMNSSSSQESIYNAPKCGIYVNKSGTVEYHNNGKVTPLPYALFGSLSTLVNTEDGIAIEWRDYGDSLEIRVSGSYVATVKKSSFGPYAGLFTSGATGYAKFHYREFFDAGTEFVQQIRTTKRNTIITDYQIYRVMEPLVIPAYRLNMPVCFIDPAIRETVRMWGFGGEIPPQASGWDYLDHIDCIFAGKKDGSAGVMCKIISYTGAEHAHVGFSNAHIALNDLPYAANTDPEIMTSRSIVAEWAPKLRQDLL